MTDEEPGRTAGVSPRCSWEMQGWQGAVVQGGLQLMKYAPDDN